MTTTPVGHSPRLGPEGRAVVSIENLRKSFGGRPVLRGVDLDVRIGEIHGLIGQNGSGKSTLVKILAGYHAPDPGTHLFVAGERIPLPVRPGEHRRLGISFVHQDLGLMEQGTVTENLRIGRYGTSFGWRIPWREERRRVRAELEGFGLSIDPDARVADLREVDRALLAIVRAFAELQDHRHGLLVLDEPTAYLPNDGVEQLFDAMRQVASRGIGVLFVSHRLEEILTITDRVSVLRDGRLIGTAATAASTQDELIRSMLGFTLEAFFPTPHTGRGEPVITLESVSGATVSGLSLTLHQGDVVGCTGLLGSGYEEVPYLLFGASPEASGLVHILGRAFQAAELSPHTAIEHGVVLLPGDRQRYGGVGLATLLENVTLPSVRDFFDRWLLRRRRERRSTRELLERFRVQPGEPDHPFGNLSGGNQQKALLAKWFATGPRVFLLHEPTHGVDVGAKREILRIIQDAARRGGTFLVASADHEDLPHLCDRVIVFRGGQAAAELHGAELTEERIVERCFVG